MLAAFAIVTLGVVSIFAELILESRNEVLRSAELKIENSRRVASRSIGQIVQSMDLSLQATINGLRIVEGRGLPDELVKSILFDNSAKASMFGAILVLGVDGQVKWDIRTPAPRSFSRAGRDYFDVHVDRDIGLFISKPFKSINRGVYSIALSRRLNGPNGEFRGVVVGTINIEFFRQFFEGLQLGQGSAMLMRTDGAILTRVPYREQDLGRTLTTSELLRRFPADRQGHFLGAGAIDGVQRLISFAQIDDYPLLVSVASATGGVLDPWWTRSRQLAATILALVLLELVLGVVLWRELAKRARAEAALRKLAADMETLAHVDKLTALPNRRHFDAAFERAWRRQRRDGGLLSLALIDVDHFKLFNDTFGHIEGDRALASIAHCISRCIRRPDDVAARYGGEEFALILPGTGFEGAVSVARHIQQCLAEAAIANPDDIGGDVTVSIGIAVFDPRISDIQTDEAVALADAALYIAKSKGRDRIEVRVTGDRLPAHDDA